MTRTIRRTLTGLAAALLVGAGGAPALAAATGTTGASGATVTVDAPAGIAADAPTAVQVSGSGFQVVPGGFGGVYVLFGWVDDPAGGSWRPSAGGATGTTLRYAVDDAARENAGYQLFVAFPGASTAVEANGGELADDGSWSATLTVPGARFSALDASGGTVEVDCATVTCGVITIGAHGVTNANNETFTPVEIAAPAAEVVAEPTTEPTPEPSATATAEPTDEPAPAATASEDDGGPSPLPVVISSVGAAVAAATAGAVVAVRRRRAHP